MSLALWQKPLAALKAPSLSYWTPRGANLTMAPDRRSAIPIAKHDNGFDALRLLAALLVIYGHAFRLTGETGPTFARAGVATAGVKIFFVISGYLIAASWRRDPHAGRYLRRRLLRIMPGLIAVTLLTAFVLGPLMTDLSRSAYFSDAGAWLYLANIAFYPADRLPGVFTANIAPMEINGSLWSLPAEMSMYLILPVATCLAFKLTGAYRIFAAAAIAFALMTLFVILPTPGIGQWLVYGTRVWAWFGVAPYFLVSAAYALCGWEKYLHRGVALALLAALMAMRGPALLQETLLVAALPYIVLSFGTAPSPLLRPLTRRADLSYGVYLYAFPVQQILVAKLGAPGGALGNFTLAAMIALSLAYLSWRFVEAPAARLGKPATAVNRTAGPALALLQPTE
ncbi:acyltransferase [Methylocapsa sp. S129]|uniref:acyltransferase family protein n=1 Tax=Methylocapsa sp. S129 TaxID=1641869 RepID=UPI00131D0335|nr:acyltransferase [Methylocapsa sp. S129]